MFAIISVKLDNFNHILLKGNMGRGGERLSEINKDREANRMCCGENVVVE